MDEMTSMPQIQMIEPTGSYVAGACNIGPEEIARRRRSGWIGLGASIVLAVGLPLYIAAIGFIQARDRFCVGFAAAGITNFEAVGTTHAIADEVARKADRRHARGLLARSAAIAVVGAVAFALLPV